MQSKSQVLVNLRSGDKIVFDVEDQADFFKFRANLSPQYEGSWAHCGDKAIVRIEDVFSAFYFPDGYTLGEEKVE